MRDAFPHDTRLTPGTWAQRDGLTFIACPDCGTHNRVLAAHDGTAWVLCANDFCTWRGRVRLEVARA